MMAAPVCSMTLLSFNLGYEISAVCEQNPPGFRKYGFDEGDFLSASAPRPVLLGVQDNDFFDPAGTEELYQEVRRIYCLFNAENQLIFSLGRGDHSYAECQQHAVGEFFSSLAESHPAGDDGNIQIFEESELYCTPEESVWQLSGSKSTGRILSDLMRKRPVMSKTDPRDFWRNSLHLKKTCIPCFSRGFQQYIAPLKLHACRFLLRTEPGIEITLKKISSRVEYCLHCQNKARLLIPRIDGIHEMAQRSILTEHEDFFILEIRGIGESLPCRPECDLLPVYRQLYPACALMSGESLLEGQVRDILCTLLLLKRCGLREVTLEADGVMRIPTALAALFSPVPAEAVRKAIPDFWMEYLMNPQVEMPYELLPFGILQYAHPFESH